MTFGIYVHWPFCRSKCPYCDFNSHVRASIDELAWAAALLRALDIQAERTPGRTVSSIFFGGGTPSLMAPSTTAAVIDRIAKRWPLDDGVEISLEANPTSVEAERFAGFASAGVNRVSLGLQALEDESLKFLGRQHSAAEAIAAYEIARRQFRRTSFDLIYARPGQTLEAWAGELDRAIELAVDHLSVYQLTIEAGTAFDTAYARGDFSLPEEDPAADLYDLTQERLTAAGMPAYEVSNHAGPGAECRHNLLYWDYGDYVGVGPGAHGRLTLDGVKWATRQAKVPETWLAAIEAGGDGMAEQVEVPPDDRLTELTMMGLRLARGIPRARFRAELGGEPETLFAPRALADLVEGGFIELDATHLRATEAGRLRLNAVLARLLG